MGVEDKCRGRNTQNEIFGPWPPQHKPDWPPIIQMRLGTIYCGAMVVP